MGLDWNNVIFSDEKKFNLDGPDGFRMFWYDPGLDKKIFSKRQNGDGSVMVWAGFSTNGKTNLVVLDGRQTATTYISTLEENLLPVIESCSPGRALFQQDNCSIHTAKSTKAWLMQENINLMTWPSRSPDLNPMENLWGILARQVYSNGRQFDNRASLVERIKNCWSELSNEVLSSLVQSMKSRCVKVLTNKGKFL